jgi:RNA polymerase sigma-70 factor, ECF subfamily
LSAQKSGDQSAFRAIMEQNNQRLYRVARAVMKDDTEAEDVVQETYLRAFSNLSKFRGVGRYDYATAARNDT